MAATLTQERFTSLAWIFERKYDGVRVLAFKNASGVSLLSRNRLPQNLPAIADAVARIVVSVAFVEWTVHGKLRHPRLFEVRT
ncbi:MAG TPA: hypothetical protein VGL62_10355 [Vicinamibacterales bacterium]